MTNTSQVKEDSRYKIIHNAGFVGLVEIMGSDQSIEQSARVSYGNATRQVSDTRNLIRYLMKHKHTSPFEQAEVRFHIKLPIFVMRQLVRHRTANLNEYSMRYSEASDEFYLPEENRLAKQSSDNKQGSSEELVNNPPEMKWGITKMISSTIKEYQGLLYNKLSRELARIVLPTAMYTECYWKMDLHNFFHFLKLRMDVHAQKEIRDFAQAMYELAKPHFPLSFEAFEDYSLNARNFSAQEIEVLKEMIESLRLTEGEKVWDEPTCFDKLAEKKMSKREIKEFFEAIGWK
jgi:thymidylate synthase (FAD)